MSARKPKVGDIWELRDTFRGMAPHIFIIAMDSTADKTPIGAWQSPTGEGEGWIVVFIHDDLNLSYKWKGNVLAS